MRKQLRPLHVEAYRDVYGVENLLMLVDDEQCVIAKEVAEDYAPTLAVAPELLSLLECAACPQCDGSGAYYDSHGEVYQCQWCYEREAVLMAAKGDQP